MKRANKRRHKDPAKGSEDKLPAELNAGFPRPVRMVEMVRQMLLNDIRRRRWTTDMPSERHLGKELRVSRPTLRLALHLLADEGVIKLQRRRPCRIVKTAIVNTCPTKRRSEIILLYNIRTKPDLTSIATLVVQLQQKCHPFGYGLRMLDYMQSGKKGIAASLLHIDAEYRPSMYLLMSVPAAVHAWFARRKIPCVILGSHEPGIELATIEQDQVALVRHAVTHLFRNGHRRIGFLQAPMSSVGALQGLEAFYTACSKLADRGVKGTALTSAGRPEAVTSAVRRMFTGVNPPTAVIFADLELGIGLYTTLASLRLHIPRQVSVLSLSHWPLLDFLNPQPTCYSAPWEKISSHIMQFVESLARFGTWSRKTRVIFSELRPGGKSIAQL